MEHIPDFKQMYPSVMKKDIDDGIFKRFKKLGMEQPLLRWCVVDRTKEGFEKLVKLCNELEQDKKKEEEIKTNIVLAENMIKVLENNGNVVILYKDTSGDVIFRVNDIEENISVNLFDVIKKGHYLNFIKMWNK
jgi:hypothetical protein